MSKLIRITEELRKNAQDEFAALLADVKMSDGKISYSKAFKYEKASAVLWLTPLAYSKTLALVTTFSDEVAWHGMAVRQSKNEFVIEDIFVYPQEVTGSTVVTDQERYSKWLYKFDDDSFNKIRMQGHSHVNMGVSPSGVDSGHREKILDQLEDSMFYIFMIWNKALKTHTLIYDLENNILYEDNDITMKIVGDNSMEVFLADAKNKVQQKRSTFHVNSRNDKRSKLSVLEKDKTKFDRFNGLHDLYDPYEL